MPRASIVVIVACAALLSGCGVGGVSVGKDEPAPPQHVSRSDLAHMVGPKRNLGPLAQGLKPDHDETGRSNNATEAGRTIDPKDSGRSLGRAGRVDGYALGYSAPGRPTSLGVVSVDEEVELFRTEDEASAYLQKGVDDYTRFEGRKLQGVKISKVETFDSDVGDEARGLRVVFKGNGFKFYGTLIGFRRGRVVGSTSVLMNQELLVDGDVERIADALDDRVQKVGSRPLAARSTRPADKTKKVKRSIDPKPLTLAGPDLPVRTKLLHRGYVNENGVRAYYRSLDFLGGLGRSRPIYIRTMVQVFGKPRLAARHQQYVASGKGARNLARRIVRQDFRGSGYMPRKVTAVPLRSAGDTAAFHFFFRVPRGRMEGVFVSVARGRVTGNVLVYGFDRKVEVAPVLMLRSALRAKLAGVATQT